MKFLHYPNLGLLILRLSLGICVLYHGIAKLKGGISGVASMLASKGLPEILAYGVYLGEILAPIMIIVGVFTRLASLILIGTCLVILYVAYPSSLFSITKFGGLAPEIIYLYLGGAFCLMLCGSGDFSLKKD